jgi:hypothetical protein
MYIRYLLGGIAALALVGSVTPGRAATHGSKAMACCSMPSALHLSMAQKRSISGRLMATEQLPPPDFHAVDDSTLPRSLRMSALPRKLARQFPTIRRDDYTVLKNEEVLLVNPRTRKVVAVIKDWSDAGLGG